ncbi:ABC-type transport auxiliary lipoprotein family protein [Roseateles asaccharophilus]|uniref:Cholesterol transport system auxiliary component n=1 Tax=Roseateles asaccharophilus TaxID=582607 RepID=A0ABU2AHJ7_9BURK|nr:ABC-type transport auxiliary lipoprotein family protein [Roseateles asaccharophilus]MDR7335922.1 cholesterol transport system auxiliary component [Roseateles asaccharophilus]
MRHLLALFTTLALSACSLAPTVPPKAIYDLGPAPATQASGGSLAWRIADVTAAPWLATEGIAYRLNFQQAQRLEHYRDSAWAAPPAALLTQRLRQQLAASPGCPGRAPALLAVHLDQFEQQFASAGDSRAQLRLHATLWSAGGGARQQAWVLERPAAPDAEGAARGLALAVDDWLPQLTSWLTSGGC